MSRERDWEQHERVVPLGVRVDSVLHVLESFGSRAVAAATAAAEENGAFVGVVASFLAFTACNMGEIGF